MFSIGLNEKLDDSTYTVLDDEVLTPETFEFLGSYTKYGEFMDGQDGYWYGFSNEGNSSGDATMLWIKISKTDYSFTVKGTAGNPEIPEPPLPEEEPPPAVLPPMAAFTALRNPSMVYPIPRPFQRCWREQEQGRSI